MTTSCIFGRILCFSSSLFGPVLLFLPMLIRQHFMLLLKFIWSRFILLIFASLVPFYAGFFCTFPSPRQAIYSHQSRPGARPSFAPTKTHYCFFVFHFLLIKNQYFPLLQVSKITQLLQKDCWMQEDEKQQGTPVDCIKYWPKVTQRQTVRFVTRLDCLKRHHFHQGVLNIIIVRVLEGSVSCL